MPKDSHLRRFAKSVLCVAFYLLLLIVFGSVIASSPEDALAYRSPELGVAQQRLTQAEADLSFWRGFGYNARATSSASYGDILDDDLGPGFDTSVGAGVGLSYSYLPSQQQSSLARVEQLKAELSDLQRGGVGTALQLHASLLLTQLELRLAEADFSAAQTSVSAAQEQPPADLEVLQRVEEQRLAESLLTLEQYRLALEDAQREFQTLSEEASLYNLQAPAVYRLVQFALPQVSMEDTYAHRALELEVVEAQTRLAEEPLNAFRSLALGAEYVTPTLGAEVSAGIFKAVPEANLGLSYPGGRSERWEVSVSAEIILDQNTPGRFSEATLRLDEAEAALRAFQNAFPDDLEAARQEAVRAWTNLRQREQRLELIDARIATLTEASEAIQTALSQASEDYERTLESQLRSVEQELSRAPDELERSEQELYLTWSGYLSAVANYLALAESNWRVR